MVQSAKNSRWMMYPCHLCKCWLATQRKRTMGVLLNMHSHGESCRDVERHHDSVKKMNSKAGQFTEFCTFEKAFMAYF